ncbi:IclR family transcriptional regulator [Geomicrobium sp. JCM 19038]|uniref:IclR family transcriptional regulator n=1 Tax=Geomicrobium sp. JCM 19038 TaxID=1460635 RepID=UPI00045F22A4|nr:IclR family transcriptional regulator [Geomicrobium sp. JCM 19038]GAK08456.1 transcriptional regulator, IclR family [Geomicrobium sp. JCM 19038]
MEWLDRFTIVMDSVSEATVDGIGISQLSRDSEISKSTLHRMLKSMIEKELVAQNEVTKNYYLGPRAMQWGSRFIQSQDPSERLRTYCKDVAKVTGLYTYLSKYQANQVYCIYSYQPSNIRNNYFVRVGQQMPAHCSSSAKAILAYKSESEFIKMAGGEPYDVFTSHTIRDASALSDELQKVRKEQIAYCLEEMETGISAISIPFFHSQQETDVCLSVVGDSNTILKNMEEIKVELKSTAKKASHYLQNAQILGV